MRRLRTTRGDSHDRLNRALERVSFHTAALTGIFTPAAGEFLPAAAATLWATVFAVSAALWVTCAGRALLERIRAVTSITAAT